MPRRQYGTGSFEKRKPGPAPTRPHGTRAAIRRHERAGEPLCEACRKERNRLAVEMYRKRNGR